MNGTRLVSGTLLAPNTVADTNWKIVGAGDFNNDHKTDLEWQNQSTGHLSVWFMDGTRLVEGVWVSPNQVVNTQLENPRSRGRQLRREAGFDLAEHRERRPVRVVHEWHRHGERHVVRTRDGRGSQLESRRAQVVRGYGRPSGRPRPTGLAPNAGCENVSNARRS
jgi:hypothetical protein